MPTPKITAVARATPPHRYPQADIMDAAGYTDAQRRAFFERSDIESRYLWIPRERLRPDESVDELAARARDGALALSETAARRALERAGWQAADVDFVVTTTCTARLTPSVDAHLVGRLGRRIGATMLGEMVRVLMDAQGLKREDVRYWVLHSAGRRVLDRARTLLELDDAVMRHSRSVLRRYGNMSSATILFVLEEMLREESPVPGEWGVMVGLGPGFAAEGALLSW